MMTEVEPAPGTDDSPPPPKPCTDCDKVRIEKDMEAAEAKKAFQRTLMSSAEDAEHELNKFFHETVVDVAKDGIDRARDSAKYVQTVAAGIGTLYTALLGLAFSVTANPLPIRGVYAALFLGLAVALSTVYLAYLTQPEAPAQQYSGGGTLGDLQTNRTNYLVKWINASVRRRRWAIRASVLCLASGVVFIAAPFVGTSRPGPVPDAAVPPEIPAQIAPAVADKAESMFEQRVAAYLSASAARDKAIEEAAGASAGAAKHEDDLNRAASVVAIVALAVSMGAPALRRWDG